MQGYERDPIKKEAIANQSVIMESSPDDAEMKSEEKCNENEFKDCLNEEKNFADSVESSAEKVPESTHKIEKI